LSVEQIAPAEAEHQAQHIATSSRRLGARSRREKLLTRSLSIPLRDRSVGWLVQAIHDANDPATIMQVAYFFFDLRTPWSKPVKSPREDAASRQKGGTRSVDA
jgi:hypothetical protein